jgi:hypothetical protein
VDGRSDGHPRPRAPEGRRPRRRRRRAAAHGGGSPATTKLGAPGHGFARKQHLRVAGNNASLNRCLHGWKGRRPRRGVHGGGRPAAGKRRSVLRSGSSKKEGEDRLLTVRRGYGRRELDGEGGGGADQLRRPVCTGGDGELRLECTRAYGFDRMRWLAHTCEEEPIERVQGALPAAEEHRRRQWRGGARFSAVAQAARARKALDLGVRRRGRSGVLWGVYIGPRGHREAVPRRPRH